MKTIKQLQVKTPSSNYSIYFGNDFIKSFPLKKISSAKFNRRVRNPSAQGKRQILLTTADPASLASEIINRRGSVFARELMHSIAESLDRSNIG